MTQQHALPRVQMEVTKRRQGIIIMYVNTAIAVVTTQQQLTVHVEVAALSYGSSSDSRSMAAQNLDARLRFCTFAFAGGGPN